MKKRFIKILTAEIKKIFKFWLRILKLQIKVDNKLQLTQITMEQQYLSFLSCSPTYVPCCLSAVYLVGAILDVYMV